MTIDKKWAENQIRHNRNTFIVALGACHLLNSNLVQALDNSIIVCKGDQIIFDALPSDRVGARHEIDLGQLAKEQRDHNQRYLETINEFYKAQRRLAVKESFEIVKAYSESVGATADFKAQAWYQFARMIRNCISHNFHFTFNKYDLAILPVTWDRITIDHCLNGLHMQENHLPPDVVTKLLIEWETFIKAH